jgi:hypothetical protein
MLLGVISISSSSCGFKAIHAPHNHKTIEQLKDIEINIANLSSTESADFYNYIRNLLPKQKKQEKYRLDIILSYTKAHSVIQSNSDTLRDIQTLKTTYNLIELNTSKLITQGSFTKINSYSTSFSPYSNISLEQESRTNLAQTSAEGVYNRLLLFFENK